MNIRKQSKLGKKKAWAIMYAGLKWSKPRKLSAGDMPSNSKPPVFWKNILPKLMPTENMDNMNAL